MQITAQSGPVIIIILCHLQVLPRGAQRVFSRKCVCACVCVFIELHITAQSGPVILVILCHGVCVCVCVCVYVFRCVCLLDCT